MTRGVLHGVSASPFVRKVRAALALKSIDYELVAVMPGAMDAAFRARNPLAKIPVWEEDGWNLPDSSVICAYLERIAPEPPLFPGDPRSYATELFWEEYADTRLVEVAGPVFFERVVHTKIFKQPADDAIVRRGIEELLPPVFDQLESLFVGRSRPDSPVPTIADLAVWSPFVNLEHAKVELDAARWPGLAAFVGEMNGDPLLGALVAEERAALAAF
jgi:glutathione S-transferase